MRIPVVILIIGVIMLIAGIILAFAVPSTATWEPESEVLADEKTLTVSAGWTSESDSLIDEVLTVPAWNTYDYALAFTPYIYGEAKNFVITGTAIEQSSPQLWFNFYVFDSVNFDLWKAETAYTSFYEAEGKTSVSFTFFIATEDAVPDTFYFVVEEYVVGVKTVVRVNATIDWVEKASIYDSSDYYANYGRLIIEESKDFVLKGNASEVAGNRFNFYVLDSGNYENWISGKAYTSYFERKNTTSTSFTIPLNKEEATSTIYFVAENPLVDIEETVKHSATLEWNEKATIATTIGGWILGGTIAFLGIIVIIIAGVVALVFKPKGPTPTPPTPPT